jgi:uncharacterized Fe-S cluster protein YjdI/CDGSH-type Zn-finger protein
MRPSLAWEESRPKRNGPRSPLEFGYSLVPEARDPQRLVETARRSAGVDPDDARVRDEKTVEGTPALMTDAPQEAPEGFREEPRYERTVERVYRNDRIEVSWEPAFCIHVAECLRGLPRVFDPWRQPWIVVENGSPDEIAEVVQRCPTGALHFRRLDGGPQEAGPEETTVQLRHDGPSFVRGKIRIEDPSGHMVREDTRVALCRCGGSEHKPFCDGTHRKIGFRSGPDRPE